MSGCGNDKKKAFLSKPTARVRNRRAEIERAQREAAGTLTGKTIFRARVVALPAQETAGIKMADGVALEGFSDSLFQLKEGSFTMVNYVRVFGLDGSLPDPAEPGITTDSAVIAMAMHGPAYAPEYMNLKCGDIIAVQFEEAPATQLSNQIPKVISKFESDEAYADRVRANLGASTSVFLGLDSSSFLGGNNNPSGFDNIIFELESKIPIATGIKKSPNIPGLTQIVENEYKIWVGKKETNQDVYQTLKKYWDNIQYAGWTPSGDPWSAAFISWILKDHGFPKASAHRIYSNSALQNRIASKKGWQLFSLLRETPKVSVGDVMVKPRYPQPPSYKATHGDAVYKISNNIAYLTGGNVGDTMVINVAVKLNPDGTVKNRQKYVAILKKIED